MSVRRAFTFVVAVLGAMLLSSGMPSAGASTSIGTTLSDLSEPSDGQTLAVSPAQLSLVFTVELTQPPGVVLQDSEGNAVATVGAVVAGNDARTWFLPITATLANGSYKVSWKAGVEAAGSFVFSIGTPIDGASDGSAGDDAGGSTTAAGAPATGSSGSSSAQTPKAVNVVARWLAYLSLGALLGGLALIAAAWPDGVEYVLTVRHFRLVWAVALAATVLNVICTRAVVTGESLASSVSPSGWSDLTDTTAGLALLARLVLVVGSAWVAFGPERVVDEATQIPALLGPALAVATFGFTRATDGIDLVLVPAGVLHVVGFAVWFGGLVLLWRVVLAGSGGRDLVDAMRGFGRLANVSMLAVLASGVLLTMRLLGGLGALFDTGYGRLLLLKALLVAGMAYAGVVNRQTVAARIGGHDSMPGRTAYRFRRAIGSEMLAGVLVLGLTGWMVGSVPEGLGASAITGDYTRPTLSVRLDNDDYDVEVGLGPATVGLNDIEINVNSPASGLVEMKLRFDPVDAYVESVVISVTDELQGRGQLVVHDVPLNSAGQWRVTATAQSISGQLGGTQAVFTVGAAPGTVVSTTVPAAAPVSSTG